jgi:hypothetical protein
MLLLPINQCESSEDRIMEWLISSGDYSLFQKLLRLLEEELLLEDSNTRDISLLLHRYTLLEEGIYFLLSFCRDLNPSYLSESTKEIIWKRLN